MLEKADDTKIADQILLRSFTDFRSTWFPVLGSGNNLTLNIIHWRPSDKILQAPILGFKLPVQRVEFVSAHKVEGRNHPVDRLAEDCNVSRWLGKDRMKAE